MKNTLSHFETNQEVFKILQKPSFERSENERSLLTKALSSVDYFKRHIADPTQRAEFLDALIPHLKYSHFPKGTAVCHMGDTGIEFAVILQGAAIEYTQKDSELFKKEAGNGEKYEKFKLHRRIIEEAGFFYKQRNWHSLKHTKNPMNNVFGFGRNTAIAEYRKAYKEATIELEENVDAIIQQIPSVEPGFEHRGGVRIEDKLLLLHHESIHEYFEDGVSSYRKARDLRDGDTIEMIGLLTGLPVQNPVIALEDLHLVTVAQGDFFSLWNLKLANLTEKKDLIWAVFPELSIGLVTQLAAVVEERVYMNREQIYEQDEEPKAFYIIKSGGVEFLTFDEIDEKEPKEKIPYATGLVDKQRKNFHSKQQLAIGTITSGSVFGEEELMGRSRRRYAAVCNKSPSLLYVIKSDVYYDVLEKYFPIMIEAIKSGMRHKSKWREDRLIQGKILNQQLHSNSPPKTKKDRLVLRSTRLMDPWEAKINKVRVNRPELVFETHTVKVTDFEERKSRNIRNVIEITTCDPDQIVKNPPLSLKLQLQDSQKSNSPKNSLKKVEKKEERKRIGPRSSEPKLPASPKARTVRKIKTKLFERNESIGLPQNIVELYHQQTRSPGQVSRTNSLVFSPTAAQSSSPIGGFSLHCNLANNRKKNSIDYKLSLRNVDLLDSNSPSPVSKLINTGSQKNFALAMTETMKGIDLLNQSPPLQHPQTHRPMSEVNFFTTENTSSSNKASLSPRGKKLYKRITSFQMKAKRTSTPHITMGSELKTFHVKSLTQVSMPGSKPVSIPRLELTSHKHVQSVTNFDYGIGSGLGKGSLSYLDAERSPKGMKTPKEFSMPRLIKTPQVFSSQKLTTTSNFETSIFNSTSATPTRIFMLNRGSEDPKPMVFDVRTPSFSERRVKMVKIQPSSPKMRKENL